ncbi:MAG: DNA-binding protein [Oscillospiraceae bacterium]|nr:DNA-binding protein [Oscillospiraceae bacterium]
MPTLGIDTSNYTTSVAVFDGVGGKNIGCALQVREGELGLRQSDALFQHVRQLPQLFAALREAGLLHAITAVAASTQPRQVQGSYMPCFLPGEGMGRALADTLDVPFYPVSHQQGHLAAAAWSAGRMDLLETPHLAWHLSGGTTELLLVTPEGNGLHAVILGGSTDISAGQLIDRTGKLLGLPFPAGKALDALAETCGAQAFPVKIDGFSFSLSGMENKVGEQCRQGEPPAHIAAFVFATVCGVIRRVTDAARALYPGLPVICSGGVASSRVLRAGLRDVLFAAPEFATDNAMGVAILAYRNEKGGT